MIAHRHRAIDIALHFGVTEATVWEWSRTYTFPRNARDRRGGRVYWDLETIAVWHAGRHSSQRQRLREKLASFEQQVT
jgi:predicted DNA-binding transcriptional regulator AlpA